MGNPAFTPQMTDAEWEASFPTDDACKAYLAARRWPDGVVKCPRCGNDKVWNFSRLARSTGNARRVVRAVTASL